MKIFGPFIGKDFLISITETELDFFADLLACEHSLEARKLLNEIRQFIHEKIDEDTCTFESCPFGLPQPHMIADHPRLP